MCNLNDNINIDGHDDIENNKNVWWINWNISKIFVWNSIQHIQILSNTWSGLERFTIIKDSGWVQQLFFFNSVLFLYISYWQDNVALSKLSNINPMGHCRYFPPSSTILLKLSIMITCYNQFNTWYEHFKWPDPLSLPAIDSIVSDNENCSTVSQLRSLTLTDHAAIEDVHVSLVKVVPVWVNVTSVAAVETRVANLHRECSVHS